MSNARPQRRGPFRTPRTLSIAVISLLAAGLAGCGTTVHLGAQSALSSTNDSSLGLDNLGTPSTAPTATSTDGSQLPGVSDIPSAGPDATDSTTTAPISGGTGTPISSGPTSALPKTISIGLFTTATTNATSAGFSTGESLNETNIDRALIAALNKQGGLDGMAIEPIFAQTDTGASNNDEQFAEACTKFTQDNHVKAVLGYNFDYVEDFEQCLTKKDVPHLSTTEGPPAAATLALHPDLFSLLSPSITRRSKLKIDQGLASGLITKKSKLGVIYTNCNDDATDWTKSTAPYIKSKGLDLALAEEINCPSGAGDVAGIVAQLQGTILRMISAGVNVVMFDAVSESGAQLLFAISANTQNFHPVYIDSSIALLPELASNGVPPEQLAKVHSFGWAPSMDVSPGHYPAENASAQRCLSLLKSESIVPVSAQDYINAFNVCDAFFLYQEALTKTGGNTEGSAIAHAVEAIGSSHISATSFEGKDVFGVGRQDAPSVGRPVAYGTACSCFNYTGPVFTF